MEEKWTPTQDEALMFNLSTNPLIRSYLIWHGWYDNDITIDVTDLTITIIQDSNNAFRDFLHSSLANYLFKLWNVPLKVNEGEMYESQKEATMTFKEIVLKLLKAELDNGGKDTATISTELLSEVYSIMLLLSKFYGSNQTKEFLENLYSED